MAEIERLVSLYGAAAGRIRTALLGLDPGRFDPGQAEKAMARARAVVKALNTASTEWGDKAVDTGWDRGSRIARTILEILGKKPVRRPATDPKRAMKDELAETLIRANNSMVKVSQDFVALTAMGAKQIQRTPLQEFDTEEIQDHLSWLGQQAVAKEESRKDLTGQIRASLASEIGADNLISINGKQWRADRYAEMAARTTMREAQTQATLELCREYDNDLVQWSDHGTNCNECKEFEGQVYSISGKNPNYPPLEATPPIHPNCEHSLLPTTDVAQDIRKAGPGKLGWLERAEWLTDAERSTILGAAAKAVQSERRKAAAAARAEEKAVAAKAEWKPEMTPEEANIWAKDSVVQQELNHNTSTREAVKGIRKEGFVPGDGAAYGKGIYVSSAQEHGYGAYNMGIRVNITKPLDYDKNIWDRAQKWYEKAFGMTAEQAGIFDEDLIVRFAKAHGYDAIRITAETGWSVGPGRVWYNVFDKKNITVIRVPKIGL